MARWLVYAADQYKEQYWRNRGTPNETTGFYVCSLNPDDREQYDTVTHGSAAVEAFIDNNAVEMESPLDVITQLRANNKALRSLLFEFGTHERICSINEGSSVCNCGWDSIYAHLEAKEE